MIRVAYRCEAGSQYGENQDRALANPRRGTFVVADGIGGLADGGTTAQTVVEQFPAAVLARVDGLRGADVCSAVAAATAELNERVRSTARHGPGNTGAATAMLLVREGLAVTVHLGDCRIYLARDGRLERLTEDHVLATGELTRFVGMAGTATPGVSVHVLRSGDRLLLCTDGLLRGVDEHAVRSRLGTPAGLDTACQELVDLARAGGAVDDISVIAVEYIAEVART